MKVPLHGRGLVLGSRGLKTKKSGKVSTPVTGRHQARPPSFPWCARPWCTAPTATPAPPPPPASWHPQSFKKIASFSEPSGPSSLLRPPLPSSGVETEHLIFPVHHLPVHLEHYLAFALMIIPVLLAIWMWLASATCLLRGLPAGRSKRLSWGRQAGCHHAGHGSDQPSSCWCPAGPG